MAFSIALAVILKIMKRKSKGIRRKRRRRDMMCMSHEPMAPEIHFDIVIEILSRLPPKSLMRFKSVSKLWSSFICSRYFSNRQLKLLLSPRLFVHLSVTDNSHLKSLILSSSPSPGSDMSSFVIDQYLTKPGMKDYYIAHVFGGLMCFVNKPRAQIYNTTTRQLFLLPDIEESNIIAEDRDLTKIMYHITHDSVYDQYKVVCIVSRASDEVEFTFVSEHWVYLLGGEGSSRWKKISCKSPPHLPLSQGFTINGRMHYLAWIRVVYHSVLVIFDTNSEEISVLQVPENIFLRDTVIEYGGKIAILKDINLENEGVMELWVMEDEEKNKWTSKIFVVHPSQMHMVIGVKVQGTTRNGEVILAPKDTNLFHIFLYDLQKNHIRKIEINGGPNRHLAKYCEVVGLDDIENLMYL